MVGYQPGAPQTSLFFLRFITPTLLTLQGKRTLFREENTRFLSVHHLSHLFSTNHP